MPDFLDAMGFRLIVSEPTDLTTIRVVGRLSDDAVTVLSDACNEHRWPLVLDLSDLTSASEAGVLLLHRLAARGVHLLGASRYVKLLLEHAVLPNATAPSPGGQRGRRLPGLRPAAGRRRARRRR